MTNETILKKIEHYKQLRSRTIEEAQRLIAMYDGAIAALEELMKGDQYGDPIRQPDQQSPKE